MNKQQITVIERAIHSDQEIFSLNKTWRSLYDAFNIGSIHGSKFKLTFADKQELLQLVQAKTGFDLSRNVLKDLSSLHREETLAIAIDEKMAGKQVKENRLAIKVFPGTSLKLNHHAYRLPDSGYLDITFEDIASSQHRCILIIENYRCFDQTQKLRINMDTRYRDPLVIFRGDNIYSENTVRQLLNKLDLPVLVMADIDPRGLVIVQSFPNVIGLISPKLSELERLFKDIHYANPDLYEKQFAGCREKLSNSRYPSILMMWEMMKQHKAGIVQEHWLTGEFVLNVIELC